MSDCYDTHCRVCGSVECSGECICRDDLRVDGKEYNHDDHVVLENEGFYELYEARKIEARNRKHKNENYSKKTNRNRRNKWYEQSLEQQITELQKRPQIVCSDNELYAQLESKQQQINKLYEHTDKQRSELSILRQQYYNLRHQYKNYDKICQENAQLKKKLQQLQKQKHQ